jgi:hypothetical protein
VLGTSIGHAPYIIRWGGLITQGVKNSRKTRQIQPRFDLAVFSGKTNLAGSKTDLADFSAGAEKKTFRKLSLIHPNSNIYVFLSARREECNGAIHFAFEKVEKPSGNRPDLLRLGYPRKVVFFVRAPDKMI